MGFTVYYRSTEPVDQATRKSLDNASDQHCSGRTWLSCEPVCFFDDQGDGHMMGGSKPNFTPHADDKAAAEAQGLPDGTIHDALDVLCRLSGENGIDWEISHDFSEGVVGLIRQGEVDPAVLEQIEAFADVNGILEEFGAGDGATLTDGEDDEPGLHLFRPDDD